MHLMRGYEVVQAARAIAQEWMDEKMDAAMERRLDALCQLAQIAE